MHVVHVLTLHVFLQLQLVLSPSVVASATGKDRHLSPSPADRDIDYRRVQHLTQRVFPQWHVHSHRDALPTPARRQRHRYIVTCSASS